MKSFQTWNLLLKITPKPKLKFFRDPKLAKTLKNDYIPESSGCLTTLKRYG
uniref:Bm13052 n=1 Tax=Brugia malayi TaxID=6279 RepID=A0A1I9G0V7_BRUMA|nr:Bm13052 [Brugia malayi]